MSEPEMGGFNFQPQNLVAMGPPAPATITIKPANRIQIHVTLLDGTQRFYAVSPGDGWKVDATTRCLIIGKGLGRIYIPLDNVESFSPESY